MARHGWSCLLPEITADATARGQTHDLRVGFRAGFGPFGCTPGSGRVGQGKPTTVACEWAGSMLMHAARRKGATQALGFRRDLLPRPRL